MERTEIVSQILAILEEDVYKRQVVKDLVGFVPLKG